MLRVFTLLIIPVCVLSIYQHRRDYQWGYFEILNDARLENGVFGGGVAKTYPVRKKSECTALCIHLGPIDCVSVSFNAADLACEVYDKTVYDDPTITTIQSTGWEYLNPKFGPPQPPIIYEAKSTRKDEIEIIWAPNFDGGFPQTITFDAKLQAADDSAYVNEMTVTDPAYLVNITTVLTGLSENAMYTVRLTATNTRPVGVNNASVTVDKLTFSLGYTCQKLKSEGNLVTGTYDIDADGNGPLTAFQVECDMAFDPPLTIVHHDIEGRSSRLGPNHGGYFYRTLNYAPTSMDQMVALLDTVSHCHQYRKIECHGLGNPGTGTDHTDRDGAYRYWGDFFPGGSPVSRCLCGKYSACKNGRSDCACNANDATWREATGYLQEKVALPFTNTRINDIDGSNEMGYETLGPLVCSEWEEGRERPIGLENSFISDSALSASNTDSSSSCALTNARVGSTFDSAWCPPAADLDTDQWLQVDLGKVMVVTKVVTQGKAGPAMEWVTKYSLLFSSDGSSFVCYKSTNGSCKVFNGNWDGDAARSNILRPSTTGRYIRFNPKAWNTHISLRVEVYGFDAGYTNTSDIPDGQSLTLTCPTGTWLDINDVFFGEESQDCRATQKAAIKAVKTPCQQRTTCTVTSGTSLFGDPCSSVSNKYMWITHKCVSILSSCYEYYMHGFTYSAQYEIDPDGPNYGVDPFMVECDMTTSPPGKTQIHHNRESESGSIAGHENCAGSGYTYTFTYYGISLSNQIPPFMATVGGCSQFGKFRCSGASGVGGSCTWLKDRGGTKIPYWAGGNTDRQCACAVDGTCGGGRTDCSCNKNDYVERNDQGYITDKTLLPVSFIHIGDTGDANEWGIYTIGPMECQPALPSCTEWKRHSSTSGAYWVDPDGGGGVDAFEVHCDMTTDPPTVTFHHDHEDRTHVTGYDGALSYSATLSYAEYIDIGCYGDDSNRAIPSIEGTDPILDGDYTARSDAINKCYQAAKAAGFKYFAVQNGGWCASSAYAGDTYDAYGTSTACASDGKGGSLASQIYKIIEASVEQVAAYIDYVGENCTQHLKYECFGSVISANDGTSNYAAWYDRNAQAPPFWPGGDPDGVPFNCACGVDGSCHNPAHLCNCDSNDSVWRADEGNVTDASYLPISMIKFGDTGGGEEGYHTVGPVVCRG